jgi:Helix-turn-helix domain
MPKPCSGDLRERVVEAVAGGASRRAAGERFAVSASSAVRWVQRWQQTGSTAAKRRESSQPALEEHAELTWTGSPQGFDAVKKMGPVRLDLATLPKHAGYGCRLYASRPDIR